MHRRSEVGVIAAEEAWDRAFRSLDAHRRSGSWVGRLSSSALSTAMCSLALHLRPEAAAAGAGLDWLVQTQHSDGGWGDAVSDPSNMNSTSVAASVLKYCGSESYREQALAGRRWIEGAGGFPVLNDPRKTSMSGPGRSLYALAGFVDWKRIRKLPTEAVLLPGRVGRTLSITFSSILSFSIMQERFAPVGRFRRPLRRLAVRRAVDWLRHAQGPDGSYGESALLAAITVVCLTLGGAGGEDIIRRALPFIRAGQRPDGSWPIDRDLENFDTTQAVLAHHEAERPVFEKERVAQWFLKNQFQKPCFHTSSAPGGWAWASPAGWPDVDDTACTLRSLRLLGVPPEHEAVRSGLAWLYGMQNRDGSWPTFVRDSKVPFDRGCPYITSQVLCALAATGEGERDPARRALQYLHKNQREDGSFISLWFRAHTCGTAAVIEALCDLGLAEDEVARHAARWLNSHQNPDGGWSDGQDAASTAEETAWASAALMRLNPEGYREAVERGVGWLVEQQRDDGGWEPGAVGVYFRSVLYSNTFYSLSYPLISLSRYRKLESRR